MGQVVQDYGSVCQSVTELANERGAQITAHDRTLAGVGLDAGTEKALGGGG